MSEKETLQPMKSKVCVVGVKSAGKTLAISNIVSAMNLGLHAYPTSTELKCLRMGESLQNQHNELSTELPPETEKSEKFDFEFNITLDNNDVLTWQVECLDVPGEIFSESYDTALLKDRESYEEFCGDAAGCVFMLSAFDLFDVRKVKYIGNEIMQFVKNSSDKSNVIIAITMFELLLIPFGGYATQYVSNHLLVKKHLKKILATTNLNHHLMTKSKDIRFVAISSYGFVPNLGSANVNPKQTSIATEHGVIGTPYESNKFYPFLVADPFVFAATGYDNDFIFHSDEVLYQR